MQNVDETHETLYRRVKGDPDGSGGAAVAVQLFPFQLSASGNWLPSVGSR
jgi:hypothetical protein